MDIHMLHTRTVLLIATARKQSNDVNGVEEFIHEYLSRLDQHQYRNRQKDNSVIYCYTFSALLWQFREWFFERDHESS